MGGGGEGTWQTLENLNTRATQLPHKCLMLKKYTHLKPGPRESEGSDYKRPRHLTLLFPYEIRAKRFCLADHDHYTLTARGGWRTAAFAYLTFPYRYVAQLNTMNERTGGRHICASECFITENHITNFHKIRYVLYIQNCRTRSVFVCIGNTGYNLHSS
jgi:hypothetical protein